jgi:hypothetical protein
MASGIYKLVNLALLVAEKAIPPRNSCKRPPCSPWAFFARPVGARLLGIYADRVGRKAALTLSVAMMCLGSLVIAMTPSAARIGVAAPSILLLARIF